MSKLTRNNIIPAGLAALLITIAGCTAEQEPAAVEPAVTNPSPSLVAQPAPVEREPGRIILAQADTSSVESRFELGTHYVRFPSALGTSSSPAV